MAEKVILKLTMFLQLKHNSLGRLSNYTVKVTPRSMMRFLIGDILVTSQHKIEDIAYLLGETSFNAASVQIFGKWVKLSVTDTIGDAYLRLTTCSKMKDFGIPFSLTGAPNIWVQTWNVLLMNVTPDRYWAAFRQLCKAKFLIWGLPSLIQSFVGVGTLEWWGSKQAPAIKQRMPRTKFHTDGLHKQFFSCLMQFLTLQHNPEAAAILFKPVSSDLLMRRLISAVSSVLGVTNTLVVKMPWGHSRVHPYNFKGTRLYFAPKERKGRSTPNTALVEAMKASGASRLIAEALIEEHSVDKQEWWLNKHFGHKPRTKRSRCIYDLTS